ncbi:hypothetical protein MDAP_000464 [Mitosporidium daphniae]|uniref:Major facilitator superfamily (MFS) profile domain-containing protein n=1 Tax=Mitosporidium daphniae TaxID=1485682 RepID=A0A098VQ39_9MICR|nr:uncharacterized protein DI09_51p50 [Mitosporidium daphniae]KGG50879.1 hypothetical protein DI09_51p50 [Mitosporidium daphniae]|eukprot:XP_013237321.1 uncharacterized protein DI09_51p50 [Mitosporidium daphniae]
MDSENHKENPITLVGKIEPIHNLKPAGWTKPLIFSSVAASIGSFIFGFNISVIDAPSQIFTQCDLESGLSGAFPTCINVHGYWNLVVTIFCIGGLIGSLSSSFLMSNIGRKATILYNCFFFMAGGLLMSLSSNLAMLLIGRLLIGFASGLVTCVVPTYLAEISPDTIRGQVASFHQCMLVIGIIFAQALAFPLVTPGLQTWRILFFITAGLGCVQLICLFFAAESPVFLASKRGIEHAEKSLKKLRGSKSIAEDLLRLQKRSSQSVFSSKPLSILELIPHKEARKSVLVSSFSHLAQQLSGINAYFFYCMIIFGSISLPFSPKVIPLILGIVNAAFSCGSVFLIDRSGRRPLLLLSTVICCISTFCIVIGFLFGLTLLKVIPAITFVAGFAIGLGPVPWIIVGDIFPSEAISSGSSLAITVNWICNSLVAFGTEMLCSVLGPFAFLPFLAVLIAYLFFILAYIPETKGTVPAYL